MYKTKRSIAAILLILGLLSIGVSVPVSAESASVDTIADDPEALASVYEAFETDLPYDENELLVELKKNGASPAVADEIMEHNSVRSSELLGDNTMLVTVEDGCTIQDVIRELAENDKVAHIEPNYELYPCGDTIEMEIK